MGPVSQCVRPDDPAFMAAFGLGIAFAVFLASKLVELEARLTGRRLAWLYRSVAWAVAEGLAFIVPIAFTALLDKWAHPERSLCTSLVWRWYFVACRDRNCVGYSQGCAARPCYDARVTPQEAESAPSNNAMKLTRGGLERERGAVSRSRHGVAGFEDPGRGARPSQLIASVRRTVGGRATVGA
jgi:hypothetical protein